MLISLASVKYISLNLKISESFDILYVSDNANVNLLVDTYNTNNYNIREITLPPL